MHIKFHRVLPAATAFVFTSLGHAQENTDVHTFAANVGVYSQYVFRGLTQTNEEPAIQGGFDYSHASGIYVGTWLANISWFSDTNPGNSVSVEWDGYVGFKKAWANEVIADIGYLRYQYPGSYPLLPAGTVKPDTDEVYVGLGWKWAMLKYSHAVSDLFGVEDSDGSHYLDLTMTIPVSEQLSIALHAGQQTFDGASTFAQLVGTDNDSLYSYEDYRATVSYSLGRGWATSMAYTHATANDAGYTVLGENLGGDRFIISLTRAL